MARPCLILLCALGLLTMPAFGQDLVIKRWLVSGPFPSDTGVAGLTADHFGGETSLLPAPDERWSEVAGDSIGRVDLNATFDGQIEWSVAYAHTYVASTEDRNVQLVLDSDDDIVAFVNGQRVWTNNTARGLAFGRDTVDVRLAEGWNSILLKIRNRTGGFGVLGRFDSVDGESLSGISLQTSLPSPISAHNYPAQTVTLGPLQITDRGRWVEDEIVVRCRAPIAAWGKDTVRQANLHLYQEGAPTIAGSFLALPPGLLASLQFELPFSTLASAAVGENPITAAIDWDGGSAQSEAIVDAKRLLRLAGDRIDISWKRIDPADGRRSSLRGSLLLPVQLSEQTVDLYPLGIGPGAQYLVNGTPREWQNGTITLCDPCSAGDSLEIAIALPADRPLWMYPVARVHDAGFVEYSNGFDYARALTGVEPAISRPDAATWLSALGRPNAYRSLQEQYRRAFGPISEMIRRDTLHLVGNSHIDAAWLWPWSETIDVIRDTWRTSLKLSEIFPGYKFSGSSAAFYHAMDSLEPALADSLRAAQQAGAWIPVGGWWVEPDYNLSNGESLVRQGLYGQRYFEQRYGGRSRVAWTPDAFGYAWSVPQIFRQSGFDYFITQKIRWNDSTEFPYNAFLWEGNDGTQILSYNPYGYTHDLNPEQLLLQRIEDRERGRGHHQIVLYGVGDHGGGPTIAMLQQAEDLHRVPTFPTMKYAHPADALDALRQSKQEGAFPIWRDELYLEYHRGTYTSQAETKRRNRRSEAMLHTLEAFASVDSAPYPYTRIETAWHRILFNQFHDILPGSSIHQVYEDAKRDYDMAWAIIGSVTAQALANIGARMDTRGSGQAVVVFNSLGWNRSGRVAVPNVAGGATIITVDSVPSYGAKVVWFAHDSMSRCERNLDEPIAGPNWIENSFLRVEIDTTTGNITRIYDKTNRREAIAPGGQGNLLQIFDDRPPQWDAWNIVLTGQRWAVNATRSFSASSNERRAQFSIERTWGNSTFRQTLVLMRDAPYLDIENDFDWHERRKLLKVGFVLNVVADSATYEIPYGTIGRSGNPRTQAERAKFEVPGQRWADVSQPDYGVSILNEGKYGWDYRGTELRLTLLKAPIWPDSLADRGNHKFRFAVYPHAGDWRHSATMRRAAEYNTPMEVRLEPEHGGDLGREFSFAATRSDNVEIAWIKRAEDSDNVVVRLVEWFGRGETVEVNLACSIQRARRGNLLEDAGDPVPSGNGSFSVQMRPYEIATVLVECEND